MKELTLYSRFGYVLTFAPSRFDKTRMWITLFNPDGEEVEHDPIEKFCQSNYPHRNYTQYRGIFKNPKVITYRMLASRWVDKFGFDKKDFPNEPVRDPKRRTY